MHWFVICTCFWGLILILLCLYRFHFHHFKRRQVVAKYISSQEPLNSKHCLRKVFRIQIQVQRCFQKCSQKFWHWWISLNTGFQLFNFFTSKWAFKYEVAAHFIVFPLDEFCFHDHWEGWPHFRGHFPTNTENSLTSNRCHEVRRGQHFSCVPVGEPLGRIRCQTWCHNWYSCR